MIWFSLIIPILIIIYLLIYHRKAIKWWEILAQFAVCLIVIAICITTVGYLQTKDTEWWGNLGMKAIHDEPYDYMSICTRTVSCGKDCTTLESYPCVESVSRHCWLRKDNGKNMHISYAKYKELVNRWGGKEKFIDMHRDYYSYDGDRYVINWNLNPLTSESIVTEHSYENKVAASSDVFNFPEVSKEDKEHYGLYDYPILSGYEQVTILDHEKNHVNKSYSKYWRFLNGKLGPSKQVRLWVLIFRNQPLQAGHLQEAYWKGGNKNEFVYCIGVDKNENIKWGHIISWTESQVLKIEARDFVSNMGKLDLQVLAEWTDKEISSKFIRKPFKDFNYLQVKPSGLSIVLSYIVILIVNIGMALWIVKNNFYD
ncbi:MAG: hypothetical protein ACFFG0_00700 [Candidatus Thorarchaeota archaeon]